MSKTSPKVTGIGGIFFKADDPKKLKAWYAKHLGIDSGEYGYTFEAKDMDNPEQINILNWSIFDKNTNYLDPSKNDFMINYRVNDLEQFVADLKANDVIILDDIAEYSYGKFVHVLDPEGHKIELWEPIDDELGT